MEAIKKGFDYENIETGRRVTVKEVANLFEYDFDQWPIVIVFKDEVGAVWARPLKEFREKYREI